MRDTEPAPSQRNDIFTNIEAIHTVQDLSLIHIYTKGITHDNASLEDPAQPGQYREMPVLGDLYEICLIYTSRCG